MRRGLRPPRRESPSRACGPWTGQHSLAMLAQAISSTTPTAASRNVASAHIRHLSSRMGDEDALVFVAGRYCCRDARRWRHLANRACSRARSVSAARSPGSCAPARAVSAITVLPGTMSVFYGIGGPASSWAMDASSISSFPEKTASGSRPTRYSPRPGARSAHDYLAIGRCTDVSLEQARSKCRHRGARQQYRAATKTRASSSTPARRMMAWLRMTLYFCGRGGMVAADAWRNRAAAAGQVHGPHAEMAIAPGGAARGIVAS